MDVGILLSFLLFLGFFAGVGLASMRVKQDTTDDYLVAGRGMHPALAALSAVSTWNSGYMFIGFIGFIYLMGYSAIWIGVVSTIGQLVAWAWLYKFIQKEGNERGLRSLSSLVSEKAGAPEAKLAAVLSVFFLAIYAAAQLTAGGKALFVMLGWPELVGILIGFVLVVAYCYAGGIRASIWTDAAQSCVMIVGSVILCWVALGKVGGFSGMHGELESQSATLVNFLPTDISLGISLYLLAFFLGGLGVAGQPQVVSRVMTLKSDEDRKQAMIWFFVWQTPFIALMFIVGLASRVLFTDGNFDAELGLPTLAMDTLPALGVGMILASIFAATMSTADSQVLACTAAITDDIKPEWREDHKTTKKVTLYVAAAATMISIAGLYIPGGDSVFTLVVLAVYGLGGIFVPLLIIRWMGYKPDTFHSIVMMISAFTGVIVWTVLGLAEDVFPSVPGVGAAFTAHILMCFMRNDSASNPFGRFKISQERRQQFTTIGVIGLCFVGIAEVAYAMYEPEMDSEEYQFRGVDDYIVLYNIESMSLGAEVVYLEDGDIHEFTYTWDNPEKLAGYIPTEVVVIAYAEETNEETDPQGPIDQANCAIDSGDDVIDDVTITASHQGDTSSLTGNTITIHGIEFTNSSYFYWAGMTDGWLRPADNDDYDVQLNITNKSDAEIYEKLYPTGDYTGEYEFTIRVDAQTGEGACPRTDPGEEVEFEIIIAALKDFQIIPRSVFLEG